MTLKGCYCIRTTNIRITKRRRCCRKHQLMTRRNEKTDEIEEENIKIINRYIKKRRRRLEDYAGKEIEKTVEIK